MCFRTVVTQALPDGGMEDAEEAEKIEKLCPAEFLRNEAAPKVGEAGADRRPWNEFVLEAEEVVKKVFLLNWKWRSHFVIEKDY